MVEYFFGNVLEITSERTLRPRDLPVARIFSWRTVYAKGALKPGPHAPVLDPRSLESVEEFQETLTDGPWVDTVIIVDCVPEDPDEMQDFFTGIMCLVDPDFFQKRIMVSQFSKDPEQMHHLTMRALLDAIAADSSLANSSITVTSSTQRDASMFTIEVELGEDNTLREYLKREQDL